MSFDYYAAAEKADELTGLTQAELTDELVEDRLGADGMSRLNNLRKQCSTLKGAIMLFCTLRHFAQPNVALTLLCAHTRAEREDFSGLGISTVVRRLNAASLKKGMRSLDASDLEAAFDGVKANGRCWSRKKAMRNRKGKAGPGALERQGQYFAKVDATDQGAWEQRG